MTGLSAFDTLRFNTDERRRRVLLDRIPVMRTSMSPKPFFARWALSGERFGASCPDERGRACHGFTGKNRFPRRVAADEPSMFTWAATSGVQRFAPAHVVNPVLDARSFSLRLAQAPRASRSFLLASESAAYREAAMADRASARRGGERSRVPCGCPAALLWIVLRGRAQLAAGNQFALDDAFAPLM